MRCLSERLRREEGEGQITRRSCFRRFKEGGVVIDRNPCVLLPKTAFYPHFTPVFTISVLESTSSGFRMVLTKHFISYCVRLYNPSC